MSHEEQQRNEGGVDPAYRGAGPQLRLFGRSYGLPASVLTRRILGVALVLLGTLGFLPVLGFWMIPLGLLILSHDSAPVRRWRRRMEVRWGRWRSGNGKNGDSRSGVDK